MTIPSWAPRPVPTMRAVGVARPRAHGQAMIEHRDGGGERGPGGLSRREPAGQGSEREHRSRPARTPPRPGRPGAAPAPCPPGPGPTSAGHLGQRGAAPTRVARTTSRPEALTRAAGTVVARAHLDRDGLAGEHRGSRRPSGPYSMTPSVATFSPGRTTNRSPLASSATGTSTSAPSRSRRRPWPPAPASPHSVARAPLGPGLQVAAEQDQGGDGAGGVEIDALVQASREDDHGPGPGGDGPDRDQGVHGGHAVAGVEHRGAVERPAAVGHHRGGQAQRGPLPAGELQRRHPGQEGDGDRHDCGQGQAPEVSTGRVVVAAYLR